MGFFDELFDPVVIINAHDAEGFGFFLMDEGGGDGDGCLIFLVMGDDFCEVHLVELIAGEYDEEVIVFSWDMF